MSGVAYAKHPLASEDAQKLRADGYKILDIKFKPDVIGKEDTVFPKPPVKRKAKKKED